MIPTCKISDVIVFSLDYYNSKEIQRGDIITYNHLKPSTIKRAVAFPGDTVEIKNKKIYINNELINEPYAVFSDKNKNVSKFNKLHSADNCGPLIIPKNKIFVLGDNRDSSYDSRDPGFGFVDINSLNHKPLYILWSRDKSRIGKQIK